MLVLQLPQEILRTSQLIVEDAACDRQELRDERISHRVAHAVAFLPAEDDLAGAEDAQLLRDDRLLEAQRLLQFLHTVVAAHQHLEERMRTG